MSKLIACINMTVDGYCDHTAMIADEKLHQHYTELLRGAGAIIYGRITYELMESYWPTVARSPTGETSTDEFAVAIENIPKIVFSRTLNSVSWKNARLAKGEIKETVLELKQQPGKDILVGSPSLIASLTSLNLFDAYQLCVHPVVAGKGLTLFKNIQEKATLRLVNTKTFNAGQIVLYYEPAG